MSEITEQLHKIIAEMTPAKIATIKATPGLHEPWRDSSTILQALCRRQIAGGADPVEQEQILALDKILSSI